MNDAARIVADRNRAATRVLAALLLHGQRAQAGIAPDFGWLEGLLRYIDETVVGAHLRTEELLVVKPLERLRPDLRAKLARMRRDRVGAGGYCFRLKEALGHWKNGWSAAFDLYLGNSRDFCRSNIAHGLLMRRTILPAAEAAFAPADWQALAQALARPPADPLAGCRSRAELDAAVVRMIGRGPRVASPAQSRAA